MKQDIQKMLGKNTLLYAGIALLLLWMIVSVVQVESGLLTLVLLVVGLLALLGYTILNIDRIKDFFRASRTQQGLRLSATLFLLTGILVLLYYVSVRQTLIREDFTSNNRFSLAKQTEELLENIDRPVKFYIFKVEGSRFSQHSVSLEYMLEEYRNLNRNIELEIVDMQEEPALAQSYNVEMPASVLILMGKRKKLLTIEDYVHMKMVGRRPQQVANYEAAITTALMNMTREVEYTVYFSRGRGEKDVANSDHGGASGIREGLESEGFVVKSTNLLLAKQVPEDCDLLIMAAPQDTMTAEEIAAVESWMSNGNPALFLVEKESPAAYKKMLSRWGVEVGNTIVIDPERLYQGSPVIFPLYTHHDITKKLSEENRFAAFVFSVGLSKSSVAENKEKGLTVEPLLRTSERAWGETGPMEQEGGIAHDPGERRGEFNLAYAVTRKAGQVSTQSREPETSGPASEVRAVVIGDSDFILNGYIGNFAGSQDFFMNAVNWTLGQEQNITIRPKEPVNMPLRLTEEQNNFIFVVALIIMPLLVIIPGIVVFLGRNK